MRKGTIILAAIFFLLSCSNNNTPPSGLLKPDKMQAVLWDIIRVDAFTYSFIKKDSSKNTVEENAKLQKRVFAEHKVSEDVFYKSLTYYKKNTSQFKSILDTMIEKANQKRNTKLLREN